MEEKINKSSFIILEHKKNTFNKSHHRLRKKTVDSYMVNTGTRVRSGINTGDSAVAIAISSVSHHRLINQGSSLKVLVAEDNDLSYLFVKYILEKLNMKIYHAQNGIEAVEMVKSIPHVDLILMDIRMPLMNGIEATRQVRMIMPDIPVIAQSAFNDDSEILNSFEAGCDDYISKPINSSLLLSKIILWNL